MTESKEEDLSRNNAILLHDLYVHARGQDPLPREVNESCKFGRIFLGHHYYILSLSGLCLGVKTKFFFKGIMHFHYTTTP